MSALRKSPLDDVHRALGARLVEFGGWDMPIQYTGVIEEHRACREAAVVFDVSHLGTVRVRGAGAYDVLQAAFTNDLARIGPGRAQYTHLLDADDAHVVDDIIVWWVDLDDFFVMPNASNTDRLVAALGTAPATTIADITATRAVLAVQGPAARERLRAVSAAAASVPRFRVERVAIEGLTGLHGGVADPVECFVAGTGDTGEDGVEIHVPAPAAPALWSAIAGAGVVPAGLGARDTLRLEAGLPLHGHELGEGITPWQANLGWVVRLDKGDFRGRAALVAERERGVSRIIRGLAVDGRQPPRAGCAVLVGDTTVGEVTSGNFSPMLGHGIALAFVPRDLALGTAVDIDIRGRRLAAELVALPFVGKR